MGLFQFDTRNVITAQDLRLLQRELQTIDANLNKEMRKEAKVVGEEAAKAIESAIPSGSPFRESNSRGRLSWDHQVNGKGRAVSPKATALSFKTSGSKRYGSTSLLSVRVLAPATVIADMAGRSGRFIDKGSRGSGYTRNYERNGVVMKHKLNGQGRGMIRKLDALGRPSRFIWPSIEADRPRLMLKVQGIVERYIMKANRRY